MCLLVISPFLCDACLTRRNRRARRERSSAWLWSPVSMQCPPVDLQQASKVCLALPILHLLCYSLPSSYLVATPFHARARLSTCPPPFAGACSPSKLHPSNVDHHLRPRTRHVPDSVSFPLESRTLLYCTTRATAAVAGPKTHLASSLSGSLSSRYASKEMAKLFSASVSSCCTTHDSS